MTTGTVKWYNPKKRFGESRWTEVTRYGYFSLYSDLRSEETFRELEPGNGAIMITRHH